MDFNHLELSDEAIKDQYDRLLRRGRAVASAVIDAYAPPGTTIDVKYVSDSNFNAYASGNDSAYSVVLNSSVPLLTMLLFERLLSDSSFLPQLASSSEQAIHYQIDYVIDPNSPRERADWNISLTKDRSFASGILSDLCMTFIVLHELGHVMCGHIDALNASLRSPNTLPMIELAPEPSSSYGRDQAWEYDADAIAVSLLMQYADELHKDIQINTQTADTFAHPTHPIENILAIMSVSLFALFSYIRGARYDIDPEGTHPHPLVRSYYTKDMIVHAASSRWDIDGDIFLKLQDRHFDNMLITLSHIGLIDVQWLDDHYLSDVHEELGKLRKLQVAERTNSNLCSWITWS